MKVISLFSGAGGLDRGFKNAGFDIIWANENDKTIWSTYESNHPETFLDRRSILDIPLHELPDCDGIIGGPPCQSWSEAGALRGLEDKRGQLFFEFIRLIAVKNPRFFLAENVPGMLMKKHSLVLDNIKRLLSGFGYTLSIGILNASDYGVPQDRKRVFFIGYRNDLSKSFSFPEVNGYRAALRDAIEDLQVNAVPADFLNQTNVDVKVANHEYLNGGFSSMYLSRNRVRGWSEPSFTILASGRHTPLHPQAPKMQKITGDRFQFVQGQEYLYRRLSVRECARLQTFPDDFIFHYSNVSDGYKMVGNAVPVLLAEILATQIFTDLRVTNAKQPIGQNHTVTV